LDRYHKGEADHHLNKCCTSHHFVCLTSVDLLRVKLTAHAAKHHSTYICCGTYKCICGRDYSLDCTLAKINCTNILTVCVEQLDQHGLQIVKD